MKLAFNVYALFFQVLWKKAQHDPVFYLHLDDASFKN